MAIVNTIHREIFGVLDDYVCDPRDFDRIKNYARAHLPKARVENCKTGLELCDALEKAQKISLGNYKILKDILRSAGQMDVYNEITRLEKTLPKVEEDCGAEASARQFSGANDTASTPLKHDIPLVRNPELKHRLFTCVVNSSALKDWRSLGRELGLRKDDLDTIEENCPTSIKERCYQMLEKWVSKTGKDAKVDVLKYALIKMEENAVAEKISQLSAE